MSKRTEAQVLEDVTQEYLNSLDMANLPSVYNMTSELMARTTDEYELENSVKGKGQKWPIPRDLQNIQIALMTSAIYPICCIACAGYEADPAYDLLGVYMSEGDNRGLYVTQQSSASSVSSGLISASLILTKSFPRFVRTCPGASAAPSRIS